MADTLFLCPKCATHLVVDAVAFGQKVPCSGCGQPILVPPPAITFCCGHCQANLCSSRTSVGAVFACPACGTDVVVPPRTAHRFASRRPLPTVTMPPEPPPSEEPFKFVCPLCAQKLQAETAWADKLIECPTCKQSIRVPIPPGGKIPGPGTIRVSPPSPADKVNRRLPKVTLRLRT